MQSTLAAAPALAKKAPAGNRPRASRSNAVPGCALTAALAAMGGRWKLFIVYRLFNGSLHFAALRRSLPQMSAKVLTEQLREMQADGLVSRTSSGPVPAPVVYELTAHGRSLLPVAEAVRHWGIAHQAVRAAEGVAELAVDARASCDAALHAA
jgi:DNA-binding HxlR family transcriptional regulator